MKKPRDIANRARESRESNRLGADGFLRKTFTLPVDDARAKAREFLREFPAAGYIENWRQLPDGQIQFTKRRLPTAD